jgi:alpha-glucosidase (family GH31 glycosyl hydrolase)
LRCDGFIRLLLLVLVLVYIHSVFADDRLGVQRRKYPWGNRYLEVEFLDDDIIHFELYEQRAGTDVHGNPFSPGPDPEKGIYATPMIDKSTYGTFAGPSRDGFSMHAGNNVAQSKDYTVTIDNFSRCVTIFDKRIQTESVRLCATQLNQDRKRLYFDRHNNIRNIYGVGNLFIGGNVDGDWVGRHWHARDEGNFRFGLHSFDGKPLTGDSFAGGGPSCSQFPMVFASGKKSDGTAVDFGLLLDQVYATSWNFGDPGSQADNWLSPHDSQAWLAETRGDQVRFFYIGGVDLKQVHRNYVRLVGVPPLPPKYVLGHTVSKFGFTSWNDIKTALASLKNNGFPVDVFNLDLQWFKGSFANPNAEPRMGALAWDRDNFPQPEKVVPSYWRDEGIHFMPIEESYVDSRLGDFNIFENRAFLARDDQYKTVFVRRSPRDKGVGDGRPDDFVWWGVGGMMDHTNPDARKWWHENRRSPLAMIGITSHWLDLGEPEMYYRDAIYHGYGVPGLETKKYHGDIHNVYNLLWSMGIAEGYNDPAFQDRLKQALGLEAAPRFWTMSRSGTLGIHRYGAMWSGDVGQNMQNLRAHWNTKVVNMSLLLPGAYCNSAAGGFLAAMDDDDANKTGDPGEREKQRFTQWWADDAMSDMPVCAHRWALDPNLPYRPDQLGDVAANRANLQRRYELTPYFYTLAHLAHRTGEPIIQPLFYQYESDDNVRTNGNENLIGDSLLFGMVAGFWQQTRDIYLPRGWWIDYESLKWYPSSGQTISGVPLIQSWRGQNVFMPPLFAKPGAILPKMYVGDKTANVYGKRRINLDALSAADKTAETTHNQELIVEVFTSPNPSSFTLIEDDGLSLAYENERGHRVRETQIEQRQDGNTVTVTVHGAQGNGYAGAPDARATVVELVTNGRSATAVDNLQPCESNSFDKAAAVGWENTRQNLVRARFAPQKVNDEKKFVIHLQ